MSKQVVLDIISKYGDEYENEIFYGMPYSQYGNLESLVLYCFIREFKPKKVFEMGTERFSRSTYLIQKALLKNGGDFTHYMCDFPSVLEQAVSNLFDTTNVVTLPGDVQNLKFDYSEIDFMFIDAHHTREFAEWYLDNIVEYLKPNTPVHVHDINLSADWYDRDGKINEAYEFVTRHKENRLNVEKYFWLEDFSVNPEYKKDFNTIAKKHFIGQFPATSLPFNASASYWLRK